MSTSTERTSPAILRRRSPISRPPPSATRRALHLRVYSSDGTPDVPCAAYVPEIVDLRLSQLGRGLVCHARSTEGRRDPLAASGAAADTKADHTAVRSSTCPVALWTSPSCSGVGQQQGLRA